MDPRETSMAAPVSFIRWFCRLPAPARKFMDAIIRVSVMPAACDATEYARLAAPRRQVAPLSGSNVQHRKMCPRPPEWHLEHWRAG